MQWQFYVLVLGTLALATGVFVGGFFVGGDLGAVMITVGVVGLVAWLAMVVWFIDAFSSDI